MGKDSVTEKIPPRPGGVRVKWWGKSSPLCSRENTSKGGTVKGEGMINPV